MLPLIFVVVWSMTWAVLKYAISRQLMDIPNARSSHEVPTPRGGGLAVVVGVTMVLLVEQSSLGGAVATAFLGGGGLVAALGWFDDHDHVGASWRLLGHVLAAAWILAWLGGAPALRLAWVGWLPYWAWQVIAVLYLVWLLNLYNFMDGIDGLAGAETVTLGIFGGLLCWLTVDVQLAVIPFLLAAAAAGFLVWNWPPARIFMGDAGSGYIGIVIGGFTIYVGKLDERLFWGWLILIGVFVVDATYTLVQRLLRGERVYEAHRSHAYQVASRQLASHRAVTISVVAINTFWLFPIALLVVFTTLDGFQGLLLAYTPLVMLAMYFRAGNQRSQKYVGRS
ncbi:glycosyltransferase family 4 protein [Marinobacter sp. NFXS9]|uniref:MraY family glycosyltransferase n=1 Tax=Marinobacter sp. NFXS9 TaxID=2818433 RepID=UPI0032DE954A